MSLVIAHPSQRARQHTVKLRLGVVRLRNDDDGETQAYLQRI